jgi:hypothetical protein
MTWEMSWEDPNRAHAGSASRHGHAHHRSRPGRLRQGAQPFAATDRRPAPRLDPQAFMTGSQEIVH